MNKKSIIGYIVIGIMIPFVLLFVMGGINIYTERNVPYFVEFVNDGLSPLIYKGEIVEIRKHIPLNTIVVGDMIAFESVEYEDEADVVISNVVEIVQQDPLIVRIGNEDIPDGYVSFLTGNLITHEEYVGKVVKIYPNWEKANQGVDFRLP